MTFCFLYDGFCLRHRLSFATIVQGLIGSLSIYSAYIVSRSAFRELPLPDRSPCSSCLKECGLTTLETRRLRGDQIEVFKILNGYENIDRNIFFTVKEERRTRGHVVTLAKKQCRLDIRTFSFSQRTVNEWNRLSADCVGASSVNIFKNKIDIYLRRAGYT